MNKLEEHSINIGFSKISDEYESLNTSSTIIRWKRKRVRKHQNKFLGNDALSILEINCGTGIDAIYLAKKGHKVMATDVAEGMINCLKTKLNFEKPGFNLTCSVLSYNDLKQIKTKFNHVFSNFGGLNFSSQEELKNIFNQIHELLEPDGTITFVIMPKICLWEWLQILKLGKTGFRRLKNKTYANIQGENIRVHYHKHNDIIKLLRENFTNFKIENLSFFGPTSNSAFFNIKNPLFFKLIELIDKITSQINILRGYGDYYIISAQKK